MGRIARSLSVLGMAVASAAVAEPKNIFVSTNSEWKVAGLEGTTYTNLQDGLNAVGAGDTVWIQDGFVCESGHHPDKISSSNGSYARVKAWNAAFTVRSESGYVDEKNGKGAYIRGEKDPDSTFEDGRGANAIRPLWAMNADTLFVGLVLENGAGVDSAETGGGAVYGGGTFSNCVMRNCSAYSGGATRGAKALYNCVLTNNVAFASGYGGGCIHGLTSAYDCLIADNRADIGSGGAIFGNNTTPPVYSNCVFRNNTAKYNAVANFNKARGSRVRFYDCDFYDNLATAHRCSGVAGVTYFERCHFWSNVATNATVSDQDGGCISYNVDLYGNNVPVEPNMAPVLVDCTLSNNFTCTSGGGGSGLFATNCTFVGNEARGNGGAVNKAVLVNCDLIGNVATNNMNGYGCGGGMCNSTATGCRIIGNSARCVYMATGGCGGGAYNTSLYNCIVSNNYARYRGAAVHNVTTSRELECCNCLIVDNRSGVTEAVGYDYGMILEGRSGNSRSANPPKFYNCTIVGNWTGKYAAIDDVELINCIVWGNTAPGGEFYNKGTVQKPDYCVVCDHTCQKDLTPGTDDQNLNCNPKLTADYRPGLPVKNKGRYFSWMDDEDDARSRDLAGGPRLLGTAPDLGCYEPPVPGLVILLR